MRIGIDFDNTIVCYDKVFHAVALERNLIPQNLPQSKDKLRDYLRKVGKEDLWTELQGYIYGARMDDAKLFPGAFDFFQYCFESHIPVAIISHRTKYPYLGPKYDLHQAAYQWIEEQGFFNHDMVLLPRKHLFFELTKDEKIKRIARFQCTHFIDDLPEFLAEPTFPEDVTRILFDPNGNHPHGHSLSRFTSWGMITRHFIKERGKMSA